MDLDLVDGRDHGGRGEELVEVVGHEVADADGADLAVGEQGLERPVGVDGAVEPAREGLVEDEQVDLVDAELAGALVEGVEGLVVAVVADPHLGLDEHVVAVDAAAADGVADAALVGVGGGGVDVAVADAQGGLDGGGGLVGRGLEDAEAEGGHLDAVVEGERGGRHGASLVRDAWSDRAHRLVSRSRCSG